MEKKISLREKKQIATKNRIYIAALELFESIGYKDSDLRTICKNADIGLGTFYNYFKDKLHLYLYIFEVEFRRLSKLVFSESEARKLTGFDKKELVQYIIQYQLNLHNHSIIFYREAELLVEQEPKVKKLKSDLIKELLDSLANLVISLDFNIVVDRLETKLVLINNTVEETIYLILDKTKEEQRKFVLELEELIYLYLFN